MFMYKENIAQNLIVNIKPWQLLQLRQFMKVRSVGKIILKNFMRWDGVKKMFLMLLTMRGLFLEMVEF